MAHRRHLCASSGLVSANPTVIREVRAKNLQAMENYDLLEYEQAQRLLKEAIALARKHGVRDTVVAQAFLNLAIVLHSGFSNVADARLAMIEAVRIDDSIEIEPAYRTKALAQMLVDAKREFGGASMTGGCDDIKGIEHVRIERAPQKMARLVEAQVGREVDAKELFVFFRPDSESDFTRAPLEKGQGCNFAGSIPAEAMQGGAVHYYLQAVNRRGVVVANRGSRDSAYIIELETRAAGSSENENPFDVKKGGAPSGPDRDKFLVVFAGGSGGGIVTGTTEQTGSDVSCCFGAALLHVIPEIGFLLRDNLSLTAVLRVGFPIGANLPQHSTRAMSGLARLRYGFRGSFDGLQVIGSIGGGFIRHTVSLSEAPAGMDVDTTASGPFLFGPGLGYWFPVGAGTLKLMLETNSLIGFSGGINRVGPNKTGFGVQFDFTLGAALVFLKGKGQGMRYQMSRMLVGGMSNMAMVTGFYPLFANRKQRRPAREVLLEWAVAAGMSLLRPLGYLGEVLSPNGPRPVICVHGYGMSRSSFLVLARRLAKEGIGPLYGFEYLTLDPIRDGAERLARRVDEVCARHGTDKVDIIGHSMGGLVGRYYVSCGGGAARVGTLITVGSPHRGVGDARFALGHARRELLKKSAVLCEMDAAPVPAPVRLITIASQGDSLVPPHRATVEGAETLVFPDVGHLALLVDRRVATEIVARLQRPLE